MARIAAITFEIEETETIRSAGGRVAYCAGCGLDVWMTTPAVIALKTGISERAIFRSIESRLLDCEENGRLLVCPRCVMRVFVDAEILNDEPSRKSEKALGEQI